MNEFKINEHYTIRCEYKKSRNGFCHVAKLYQNGSEVDKARCHYINRTWEKYDFQTVLHKLIDKASLIDIDKDQLKVRFEQEALGEIDQQFKTIGLVASFGDLFGKNKKEANDWKKRMLKAGYGEGLNFPEDWDRLSEEEKEKRLNRVIKLSKTNQ